MLSPFFAGWCKVHFQQIFFDSWNKTEVSTLHERRRQLLFCNTNKYDTDVNVKKLALKCCVNAGRVSERLHSFVIVSLSWTSCRHARCFFLIFFLILKISLVECDSRFSRLDFLGWSHYSLSADLMCKVKVRLLLLYGYVGWTLHFFVSSTIYYNVSLQFSLVHIPHSRIVRNVVVILY